MPIVFTPRLKFYLLVAALATASAAFAQSQVPYVFKDGKKGFDSTQEKRGEYLTSTPMVAQRPDKLDTSKWPADSADTEALLRTRIDLLERKLELLEKRLIEVESRKK